MVLSDINTVTNEAEKRGGRPFRSSNCRVFLNFLNSSSLDDLGFPGASFTWDNGLSGINHIQERLDHVLANSSRLQIYPHTHVIHLLRMYSDHCPILVDLTPDAPKFNHPFRD